MKKKALTLLLAVTMALAVPMTAFATESGTTSDPTSTTVDSALSTHTFVAYQIFSGTYSNDGTNETLSDIEWSDSMGDTAKKKILSTLGCATTDSAATAAEKLAAGGTTLAESLAKAIASDNDVLNDMGGSTSLTDGMTTKVGEGYWIIIDTTTLGTGTTDSLNAAVMQTSDGYLTVEDKHDTVEVKKKVKDVNDSVQNSTSSWQDSADHDKTDMVEFLLVGDLVDADALASYVNDYVYEFHDVQSTGLTFDKSKAEMKVYLSDVEYNAFDSGTKTELTENTDYTVVSGDATTDTDCTFEVKISDLQQVLKNHSYTLTDDTKIYVYYKAELNEQAIIGSVGNPNKVYLKYSNNPYGTGTGETPKDTVIVFTYEIDVTKLDGAGTPDNDGNLPELTGATFALYKQKVSNTTVVTGKNTEINKSDPTAPSTYEYNNVIYDLVSEVNGEQKSLFGWDRIDDGNYLLVEVKAPTGYNTINPIELVVSAEHETEAATPQLTKLTMTKDSGNVEVSLSNGANTDPLTFSVTDNKGSVLPSTGGIGTTIFYVIGGILIVGAGVLLFVKTRTKK